MPTIYINRRLWPKAAGCFVLIALADFLFYGHDAGWTLGLFDLLLLGLTVMYNPRATKSLTGKILLLAGLGLVAALINAPSFLAWALLAFDFMVLATLPNRPLVDARQLPWTFFGLLLRLQALRDAFALVRVCRRLRKPQRVFGHVVRLWLLPIALSSVFLLLFSAANPVITDTLGRIDWWPPFEFVSFMRRLCFWMFVGGSCWMLIRPRLAARRVRRPRRRTAITKPLSWCNPQSTLISLTLFNALFLMQSGLDVAFLWSGATLPHGMTYAAYAHHGAYPLMLTAVLAGGFVLAALRPGSDSSALGTIRVLVYAWIGQNVFMVLSCALRMAKYIEAYSLTELRVAVLIWMALVALGLVLIVARIFMGRSSRWLVNANAIALTATLYGCCFLNFPSAISQYNVEHCAEVAGSGPRLDTEYLEKEGGIEALPAVVWFQGHRKDANATDITWLRRDLEILALQYEDDWRIWNLRDYRIAQRISGDTP